MKIRVAGASDADDLVALISAFRDHLEAEGPSEAEIRAYLPELLADDATELGIAWSDDGQPVGYTNCRTFRSLWSTGLEAHLEDLFVVEDHRGSGVGRALLAFAIDRAGANGCGWMGLHTNEGNVDAQAFYQKLGFEPASEDRWEGGREVYWVRQLIEEEEE